MIDISSLSASSPAELFMDLWISMPEEWNGGVRANEGEMPSGFRVLASAALKEGDALEASSRLCSLLHKHCKGTIVEQCSAVLWLMRCIDDCFYQIHPRQRFLPGLKMPLPKPLWLEDLADTRLEFGHYWEASDYLLIPKGPLTRHARQEFDAYADSLSDRFSSLTLVPKVVKFERHNVANVEMRVIESGVMGIKNPSSGKQSILFAPIAEASNDVTTNVRYNGKIAFVDYRPASGSSSAKRLFEAIDSTPAIVDIVIAPEFVFPEDEVESLRPLLTTSAKKPAMVIVGSGQTTDVCDNLKLPWNEAQVVNGCGITLWRQRKVVPSLIDRAAAINYKIETSGSAAEKYYEDTASGVRLLVADTHNLGRCIVLICQDIKSVENNLIFDLQPDWVFIPILDRGVSKGGWAHQRLFELSDLSQARYIVSSSTWLAHRVDQESEAYFGMAVGPKSPVDGQMEYRRAVAMIKASAGNSSRASIITWGGSEPEWEKTNVAVDPK